MISLILVFLFIVVPILGHYTSIEFTNDSYADFFEEMRFFALPIIILCSLSWTITKEDKTEIKVVKVVLTIVASIFSVAILFTAIWSGMCAWTTNRILFYNKSDTATKIVLRDFGCGATDSGSPTYRVCKIENISSYLIRVTTIDTTKIDRKIWIRVDNKD